MTHSNRLVEPRCVLKEADSRGERVLVRRGLFANLTKRV